MIVTQRVGLILEKLSLIEHIIGVIVPPDHRLTERPKTPHPQRQRLTERPKNTHPRDEPIDPINHYNPQRKGLMKRPNNPYPQRQILTKRPKKPHRLKT